MLRTSLIALAASTALTLPAFAEGHGTPGTIVEIAVADGNFTTLVAAVEAAGLVETLSGEGPFTVFAPTDAAFAALPEGTVAALLEDIPTLTGILTYHVIPGAVMAADLSDGMMAETVNGQSVTFTLGDGGAMIDGAKIVATDIAASNGVIHVIDAVIMPD
ncbi:MAG: fasciclin domain-containing protein [Pararhodobacter sp.]